MADGTLPEYPLVAFGELATFRNGMNFTQKSKGERVKIVGVGDFAQRTELRDFTNLDTVIANSHLSIDDLLIDGDLLFVRSNGNKALIGRCMSVWPGSERATFSGFSIRARIDESRLDRNFARIVFQSNLYRRELHEKGGGGNISNLNQEILSEFEFPLPPLSEQRRIAQVLSDFDRAIEATGALIEARQRHKRALIDRTFPDLPQTHGFRQIAFGELGKFVRGVTYDPEDDTCAEGQGIGICGATQIQDGRLLSAGKLVWVRSEIVSAGQCLREGDFAIATSNGSKSLVGKAAEILVVDRPLAVGGFSALLRPAGKRERQLARHLFQSTRYKRFLHIELSGSSIGNLYTSALETAGFDVPMEKLESSLALLDAMGEEIELLVDKSGALYQQRRGLMQQLLYPARIIEALAA